MNFVQKMIAWLVAALPAPEETSLKPEDDFEVAELWLSIRKDE